jgi:hypothetical protein
VALPLAIKRMSVRREAQAFATNQFITTHSRLKFGAKIQNKNDMYQKHWDILPKVLFWT